jgi:endonuclease YncB( thermonuclease family)
MPTPEFKPILKLIHNHDAPLPTDLVSVKRAARFSGNILRFALLFFALFGCLTGSAAESTRKEPAKWVTLTGCKFMSQEHSDGDSFHVKFGQRELIFRLYFVDAPETDESLKDRIRDQGQYFGVTPKEVLKTGESAKKFTAQWLQRPFTVRSRWQNAMGRSRLPRYYALIEANGQDLGELLVSRGLARAKGTMATMPDGSRAKDQMEKLRKLEAEARSKPLGIWAQSKSASKSAAQ